MERVALAADLDVRSLGKDRVEVRGDDYDAPVAGPLAHAQDIAFIVDLDRAPGTSADRPLLWLLP